MNPSVAGIVLAAGASRRMGEFKLLLPWRGRPVLDHVLAAARAARLGSRLLVLGHRSDAVRAALDLRGFTVVENPEFAAGQSTSMRAGLRAAPAASTGYLFLLGDQPNITPAFIDALIALHAEHPDRILVPTLGGEGRSPVLFPAALRQDLEAVRGDRGGREILRGQAARVHAVVVENPDLVRDLDVPADLPGA